jgi:hypothetical protein
MIRALVLPLSLLVLAGACSTPRLELQPRYGTFEPEGDIAVTGTASGFGVAARNSVEALGLQEDEDVFGGRADVRSGIVSWTFAWQGSENGGRGTLEAEISDEDVTIPAGTTVDSVFDLGLGEALVTFDVVPGDTVELGLGLGVSVLDLDVSVSDVGTGETIEPEEELLLVPVLGVRAGVRLWRLQLEALLGGVDLSYDGDDVAFYDLDAFARLDLFGTRSRVRGGVAVGYRFLDLEVDYEDDDETTVDADVDFDGPYVALFLGL